MKDEIEVFNLDETIELLKKQPLEPFNLEHASTEYKNYLDALKSLFKDVPEVSIDNFSYTFDNISKTFEINCYAGNEKYKACFILIYTPEPPQNLYKHVTSTFMLDKYPPKGVFDNFDKINPLILECMDKSVELFSKFLTLTSITDLASLKRKDVSLIFDGEKSFRFLKAINVKTANGSPNNLFSAILVEQKKEPEIQKESEEVVTSQTPEETQA